MLFSCRGGRPEPVSSPVEAEPAAGSELPAFPDARFNITGEELPELFPGLPAAAAADPAGFLELAAGMLETDSWRLALVDKNHPLPEGFTPPEIVSLDEIPGINVSRGGLELEAGAAESLARLCGSAADAGLVLKVSSAYRSYSYQEKLFEKYSTRDGEAVASRYSARPGTSQHQLGTTVDFGDITNGFADSDVGRWLYENGPLFGWSLSYPKDGEEETGYMWESWHWRHIGTSAAAMQEKYFDGSQQALLVFWDQYAPDLAARRIN